MKTITPETIDPDSTQPKAEVKNAEASTRSPEYVRPDDVLRKPNMPLFIMIGGWLFNFVYYTIFKVKFFGEILTIPNFVGLAANVFFLTLTWSLIAYLVLIIVKLLKKRRPSFFIPSLIIFLLTFTTISLHFYERYYEKYEHHLAQKEDKLDFDAWDREIAEGKRQERPSSNSTKPFDINNYDFDAVDREIAAREAAEKRKKQKAMETTQNKKNESIEGQFYRSNDHYFSIYLPDGWTIEKGRNPHVVVKSRSPDSIGSLLVIAQNISTNKSITDLLKPKDMVKKYIDVGWNVKIIESGETTFWNEKALYVKFLATINHLGNTVKMLMSQIAFNHLNKMYSIGYSAGGTTDNIVNQNYNYYESEFQKSLASFALDDWNRPD